MLGKAELDQLLSERERLNEELQKIIDESTEPWGVKVTAVEIKDVEIPEQMQRAMARQAEAERERRAKIINSEGEFQAAQKLTDAADIISTNPASLQLRYLQTLLEIGSNQNTTIVFPLPMDVLEPFIGRRATHKAGGEQGQAAAPGRRPRRDAGRAPARARHRRPAPLAVLSCARDTHRPADRAEDDPRPRPGRPPGQLRLAAPKSEPKGAESCPFCEGREDRTPPEVYALRPGGGERRQPRLDGRGWCRTSTRRSAARRAGRGAAREPRPAAEAGAFASSGDPLLASRRAGEPDLFSSRPAVGAHEVIDQRTRARDRDGRARRGAVRRRGRHLARADARPRRAPPTCS